MVINNFINVDKLINNSYEFKRNTINFFIKKNLELETSKNNSLELSNEKLIVFLPIGFLHDQLLRYCISISAIKVDAQISKDENWVIILFEENLVMAIFPEIEKYYS